MQFRLVYDGPLFATQKDPVTGQRDARADHKHQIRKVFHGQLKQLWGTNKYLKTATMSLNELGSSRAPSDKTYWSAGNEEHPLSDVIASLYKFQNYNYVPLVRADSSLVCSLEILFLRRDVPGSVIQAGDIDNRVKTLIDGLRMPNNAAELAGNENPSADENPFFCLLEDDKLITSFSVEADTLLKPDTGSSNNTNDVHIVVTVNVRPYNVTMENLNYT